MPKANFWLSLLVLLAVAVCVLWGFKQGWFNLLASGEQAQAWLLEQGRFGVVQLILLCTLFQSSSGPRVLVAFLLGYLFGVVNGLLATLLVSGLSLTLTYWAATMVLKPIVMAKFDAKAQRFQQWMGYGTVRKTLIVRLLPVGSNFVTNLIAGATRIHYWRFLLGSMLGYIPQALVFTLMGSGVGFAQSTQVLIGAVLFIVAGVLGWYLYKTSPDGAQV